MENILDGFKDLGNLAEINNFNFHFKDYELILFDSPWKDNDKAPIQQEWYLMGSGLQKDKEIEHKFSNPEILISLINLSSKIINGNGLNDELSFCEDIIQWCKKYGLPYYENYFMKKYYEKEGIGGVFAFRLREFKRRIAMLHDAFQLWYGLTFDDRERIIKYSHAVGGISPGKKLNDQIPFLKEMLSYDIQPAWIQVRYNKTSDSYAIIPYANDLISVAYFQLAMLMTNNGTKNVKFCSICNKLFEIEHGSQKICNDCKKEYHRIKTKESRERKKRNLKYHSPL